MERHLRKFAEKFLKEIEEGNAAVFLGSGMSAPCGYVDWKTLITPLAEELGMNINKEHDFVSITQFFLNQKGQNRSGINSLILEELTKNTQPSISHEILARLPITTYWTTNYDRIMEKALEEAGKKPDKKYTVAHLATTVPKRDAVIYKMHGDVEHPEQAVITKDDYEKYELMRGAFSTALSGDLVSKTFLFLGFSFTDPNLDYILSRIRVRFKENQREHFCIFKERVRLEGESQEDFEHYKVKQQLQIEDLKRFNIQTLLIQDYEDINTLLRAIENAYKRKTVFISGSAGVFANWSQQETEEFLKSLGKTLIEKDYRVTSGLGLGVGQSIITGAIEAVYRHNKGSIEDNLIMRPFPQHVSDTQKRKKIWTKYRKDLLSRAGIAIFVLGNKQVNGEIQLANGVREEFQIAHELGLDLIPVGASKYVSEELWQEVMNNFDKYYPEHTPKFKSSFEALGDSVDNPQQLLQKILDCIECLTKG